jgi:hypothetical protein
VFCRWREWAKKGKDEKIPLKKDDGPRIDKLKQAELAAEELKRKAKTTEEKLHAAQAVEKAKAASKEVITLYSEDDVALPLLSLPLICYSLLYV